MRRFLIVTAAVAACASVEAEAVRAASWHGTVETVYRQNVTETGITETTKTNTLIALRLPGTTEHHAKGPGHGDLDYQRDQTYNPPRVDGDGCHYSTVTSKAVKDAAVMAGDGDSMIEYEVVGPIDNGSGNPRSYQLFARDQVWLPDVGLTEFPGLCRPVPKPPTNWLIASGGGTFEEQPDGTIQGTVVNETTTTIMGQTVTTRAATTAGLSTQLDTDHDCITDLKELSDMFDEDPTGCIDPLLQPNYKEAFATIERWEGKLAEIFEISATGCEFIARDATRADAGSGALERGRRDPDGCPEGAEAAYLLGAAASQKLSDHAGDLADDPPDPDYAHEVTVATPSPVNVHAIRSFLTKRAAAGLERWINHTRRIAAASDALLQVIERWQGAVEADDYDWAGSHVRAAGPISEGLAELFQDAGGLARRAGETLEGTGFGDLKISSRVFGRIQTAIESGGRRATKWRNELAAAGLDLSGVTALFEAILQGPRPRGTIAEQLMARGLRNALADAADQTGAYAATVAVPTP